MYFLNIESFDAEDILILRIDPWKFNSLNICRRTFEFFYKLVFCEKETQPIIKNDII